MKPITNILLVLSLICYVFLPFYDLALTGTVSGLNFTAGTISQALSFRHVLLASLPFIACFAAVLLNCLKKRWWVIGTIACIIVWLWFYSATGNVQEIMLQHSPDVTPDIDVGEGFSVNGMGIGYKLSYVLTALSLVSALISLLPFKFNATIEKAVDDTFEDGRRHVRQEFNRLENLHKSHKTRQQPTIPSSTPEAEEETEKTAEDKEDPTRFMPK